jgi:hypothetical protein
MSCTLLFLAGGKMNLECIREITLLSLSSKHTYVMN